MENPQNTVQVDPDVIKKLDGIEAKLKSKRATLADELSAVDAELERLQLGIAALSGQPIPRTGRRASRTSKGGLTDAEVANVITKSLSERPHTTDELKTLLLEHAKARGASGTGVHLALQRVLKHGQFKESREGWSRAAPPPTQK